MRTEENQIHIDNVISSNAVSLSRQLIFAEQEKPVEECVNCTVNETPEIDFWRSTQISSVSKQEFFDIISYGTGKESKRD